MALYTVAAYRQSPEETIVMIALLRGLGRGIKRALKINSNGPDFSKTDERIAQLRESSDLLRQTRVELRQPRASQRLLLDDALLPRRRRPRTHGSRS